MKKRIVKLIMIVMIFTLISNQLIFAHPSSQSGTIEWGELCGWSIYEACHSNSTNITYKFDSNDRNMTDTYKNIIRGGASKWSSYGTIGESSAGTGTIHTFTGSNTIAALFYDQAVDSSGHLTYWKIKFNREYPFTSTTAAHEFGHAFGLMDLYNTDNYYKLMCFTEQRFATAPTTQDAKGLRVITGQHTYHYPWAYKAVPGYPASLAVHMRYCTVCDGYKIESCSQATGACSICGVYH